MTISLLLKISLVYKKTESIESSLVGIIKDVLHQMNLKLKYVGDNVMMGPAI